MSSVPAENANESYRAGFDGLRAVAVSLVWLSHLDARHFYNGVIGVDIFFVLSGYLITGVLAQEDRVRGRIDLLRFYARRRRSRSRRSPQSGEPGTPSTARGWTGSTTASIAASTCC